MCDIHTYLQKAKNVANIYGDLLLAEQQQFNNQMNIYHGIYKQYVYIYVYIYICIYIYINVYICTVFVYGQIKTIH